SGVSTIAIGTGASAANSVAIGTNATADNTGTAVGDFSTATGANSAAYGRGATATHANSAAFGNGATTQRANQQVFGTATNTYTMTGIASDASRAEQRGPLEVVTSDINGNRATDGGLLFDELSRLGGGVAIAMALENPDLVGNEKFGLAGNVAFWEDNIALGFTAMGVLGHNFLGAGERWALSGGVGFTVKEESYGRRGSKSSVGGRAGLQVSW